MLVNTQSELIRDPNLLVPQSRPVGMVKIDWTHPLAKDLVYCSIFHNSQRVDLVSGNKLSLRNSANFNKNKLETTAAGDNSAYSVGSDKLYSISNKISIFYSGYIQSVSDYAGFIGVPYRTDSWLNPYVSLAFGRDAATTVCNLSFAQSSSLLRVHSSSSGFIDVGTPHSYAVTLSTVSGNLYCDFYRDGIYHSSDTPAAAETIDWNTNNDIVISSGDSYGNVGDGVQGTCDIACLWGRLLSTQEHIEMNRNPYQFLIPA